MLAKFKWLIVALCFVVQFMVLPMIPGIGVYPDVALAGVCALALIYGPGVGMFYGMCMGVLAGSLFTLSLARTAIVYALLGLGCGLLSFKARASRFWLPVVAIGVAQVLRQLADIAVLIIARTYMDMPTVLARLTSSTLITVACALPIYWLLYHSNYKYHVIGKRVGL